MMRTKSKTKIVSARQHKALKENAFQHTEEGTTRFNCEAITEYSSAKTVLDLLLTPFYAVRDFIKSLLCNVKCAYQRAKKGYCDRDVWDMDHWFLSVVPQMLAELKQDPTLGCPQEFAWTLYRKKYPEKSEDEIKEIWRYGQAKSDEYERVKAEWLKTIDRMIFLFGEAADDSAKALADGYHDKCLAEAFGLFAKYFDNLWA